MLKKEGVGLWSARHCRRRRRRRGIPYISCIPLHTIYSCGHLCGLFASRLEIDGPVGGRWGQNAADPADDEKAESPPFLSPRARHLLKSALAFSLTLALYGPVLKAFDLPAGSPVFALSSVI